MDKEKVKEIKKALMCCSEGKCEKCPIGKKDIRRCIDILLKDALTLINDLENESERLLNEKWDKEDDLDNYHEENQQLKDRIAELEFELSKKRLEINALKCGKEIAKGVIEVVEKEETKLSLKHFAERLFEKYSYDPLTYEGDEDIEIHLTANELDETLKEFTDGKV